MCLVGWCSDEWEFGVQYNWVIGEPNEKIMRGMFWNDCLVIWVDESEWAVFRFVLMHPLHSRWVGPTKLWGCCSALAMTEISCDGQTAQHFHSVCVCVCVCVCEIFASLLAQLTLLHCRNARISDSLLLSMCLTLWKHFGLSAFCTSTFVARWCFCYSLPSALSRLCLALQALGVNGWLRNE